MSLSFLDTVKLLSESDVAELPKINVAILGNCILEPGGPYWRYEGLRSRLNAELRFGRYDNLLQDAATGIEDLFGQAPDFIFVFHRVEGASPALAYSFCALPEKEITFEKNRISDYVHSVLTALRARTDAPLLWHSFETPGYPAFGIWENSSGRGQNEAIRDLNNLLRTMLMEFPDAYFVDANLCRFRIGDPSFYDDRNWRMARAPYSLKGFAEIAAEDFKYIRALRGMSRKCLVLDGDNTLWGGILSDDGISGIHLGEDYPGSCYRDFQLEILNLYNRGVILALCSKNAEEEVWEVFDAHPDMILKRAHFAAARIDWNDKASNIASISEELNIGLDSIVFMDDSPFEVNLIKAALPDVESIQLPDGEPSRYRRILISGGWFESLSLTEEDRNRGRSYRALGESRRAQKTFTNINDYLRFLDMSVFVEPANEFTIPRVSQLSMRTNQFNLTARRYRVADIAGFAASDGARVVSLRVADRFGDMGIVGACVLLRTGETAAIDLFVLSCRVMGRGVEDVFLSRVADLAKKWDCHRLVGEYICTKKNHVVEFFYGNHGFKEADPSAGEVVRRFEFDLENGILGFPDHFKSIESALDE